MRDADAGDASDCAQVQFSACAEERGDDSALCARNCCLDRVSEVHDGTLAVTLQIRNDCFAYDVYASRSLGAAGDNPLSGNEPQAWLGLRGEFDRGHD